MTSRIEGHVLTNVLQVVMSIRGRFLFFCSGVNTHAIVFVGIGANTQNYIDGTEHEQRGQGKMQVQTSIYHTHTLTHTLTHMHIIIHPPDRGGAGSSEGAQRELGLSGK